MARTSAVASPNSPAGRLGFRTKFLYGFGSIAFGVHVQIFALLLFYYNQVVGVPAGMVSLALAATLIFDAAWEPVVGQFSDGLRTRWGRRHPLMYFSAIPVAVTMIALWRPPAGFTDVEKAGWLFAFVLAARMMISLYEVPSSALAPELAPDYHERTTVLGYRWVFFTVGGAAATLLGYFVFFRPTPQFPQGQLNPDAWGPMTLTAAALMTGSIVISALGTHDRIKGLHQPPARKIGFLAMLGEAKATLANWNLGVALAAALAAGLAYGLYFNLGLYIDTYFWGLKASGVGFLQLANLLAVFPGAWAATAISRRFGKKHACVGIFAVSVVLLQGPILLRLLGAFPANGSPAFLPLLIGVRFLWGVLNNAGYIVVTSMIADITEDAQAKTGRRSEGLVMATNAFINKSTTGVANLLPGLILALVAFPAKGAGPVSSEVVAHLAWAYLPSTTALSVLSIGSWLFYRIDQATHERNLAAASEARALAEAQAEADGEAARAPARVV